MRKILLLLLSCLILTFSLVNPVFAKESNIRDINGNKVDLDQLPVFKVGEKKGPVELKNDEKQKSQIYILDRKGEKFIVVETLTAKDAIPEMEPSDVNTFTTSAIKYKEYSYDDSISSWVGWEQAHFYMTEYWYIDDVANKITSFNTSPETSESYAIGNGHYSKGSTAYWIDATNKTSARAKGYWSWYIGVPTPWGGISYDDWKTNLYINFYGNGTASGSSEWIDL
ncbi:MAG: hypothetical protein RO469_01755 [Thermincola sp.]|jgi:hypothetical protein|nr:hypothetical protein [Thermincola sp.]MDT3703692.1 hypothetical protein [Thermincola sp.]